MCHPPFSAVVCRVRVVDEGVGCGLSRASELVRSRRLPR